MANGPPSASWHPALMPDSHPLPPVAAGADASNSESLPDPAQQTTPENIESPGERPQASADTWLTEEGGADDLNAWLVSDDPIPPASTATQGIQPLTQRTDAEPEGTEHEGSLSESEDTALENDTALQQTERPPLASEQPFQTMASKEGRRQSTHAQHSSSMSFARTVSHEVSFVDDDTEWNLTRSDPDASRSLPQPDRSNSFPDVPPWSASHQGHNDQPLPSTQVLNVMEEAEKDAEIDEQQYLAESTCAAPETLLAQSEDEVEPQRASRAIGGETQGFEAQDFDARYEEGVPLVSNLDVTGSAARNTGAGASVDLFADDAANDDDFFAQRQEPGVLADDTGPHLPLIERKYTAQAMGGLHPESSFHQSTPGETASEHAASQAAGSLNQSDSWDIPSSSDLRNERDKEQPAAEDVAAKWQEIFAGDEDGFLSDDEAAGENAIDAAAFLGSDDEGLLDDEGLPDDAAGIVSEPQSTPALSNSRQHSVSSPYIPAAVTSPQPPVPHFPVTSAPLSNYPHQRRPLPSFNPGRPQGQTAELRPENSRVSSFADKSKGGYSSPYDLPTDLLSTTLKPRKRSSLQQLPREQPPPPRSSSMFAPGHPPPSSSLPPPTHPFQGPSPNQRVPTPSSRNSSSFFEDLPITVRPGPRSRQGSTPRQQSPYVPTGQHSHSAPPPAGPLSLPANRAPQPPPGVGELVAPERVNPYAAISSPVASAPPSTGTTSRYSPASSQQPISQGSAPPAASSRYSPAPPGPRPSSSHSHGAPATPSQAELPHLPRTSSPLAHFEASSDKIQRGVNAPNRDAHHPDRRSNSFEHRLNRVSSLPPTREVDEEEDDQRSPTYRYFSSTQANRAANMDSRFIPAPRPAAARQKSPPSFRSYGPPASSSLQRAGSNYIAQAAPAARPEFAPPPRPSTQSPVAAQGGRANPADYYARPSSAHASAAPLMPNPYQPLHPPTSRRRGQSLSMNMVPPTDGRKHDPLQRWKGTPLLTWGVGGTIATSFPKSVPRYTMNQTVPTMLRTAGEVKVQNIKDVDPLADQLARFPGPLKGKSRKKEALAWLAAGIDAQEKHLPDISFHSQLSLGAKRGVERLLLWKLLRVFIEFDGSLEGNSNVEKAVKDVLAPETASSTLNDAALIPAAPVGAGQEGPVTSMMADSADPASVEQIRLHLLRGNRETAVWSAVDKRLWGHAMLISHTVSPDLYKQVSQEFVRKEVNYPGHNESIAALYKVLSGNFEDCVDELVPMHARVGLQLVSKHSTLEPARDAADGLDKWRETLTLILNNRSSDDVRGLKALGKLLSSYGRAEAAQICFIFSRSLSVFGGLDDQNADFVLVGSDHRQQSEQFAKETEALQLSEVYEYGLSLAGGAAAAAGAPHLAAYKFQHAVTLTEYGYQDKALQYCDAIASAMVSQTRRSPYHNAILEAAVDDFMTRLKQAPKDASSSWISKPSMNKVSDSMWNRFNKFVAGDEGEKAGNGAAGEADHGPFARIVTTPNLSRSPSVSNFETYGGRSPGYAVNSASPLAPGASAASSRYAPAPMQPAVLGKPFTPMSQYAPASASSGRNSNEYSRNAYEPVHPGTSYSPVLNSSGHAPTGYPAGGPGYQPGQPDSPAVASNSHAHSSASLASPVDGSQLLEHQQSPGIASQSGGTEANVYSPGQGYQPPTYGYQPLQMTAATLDSRRKEEGAAGGYEPPSYQPYAYEPPSYQPDPEPSAESAGDAPRPTKSFMDDDDDVPALRPGTKRKTDKDRENEEMFRKAAEEDAKRAAAQQSAKKGWGFSGWFGGSKKAEANMGESSSPGKPVRAKLGEASSFVYDPELKRWINKKPGAENTEVKKATPPPPRAGPWSVSGTPAPSSSTPPPPFDRSSAPPLAGPLRSMPALASKQSQESLGLVAAPPMIRSASNSGLPSSGPPSRPATSMSNASSIDDLLGAASRKAGQKKGRKSGRYVDVMVK